MQDNSSQTNQTVNSAPAKSKKNLALIVTGIIIILIIATLITNGFGLFNKKSTLTIGDSPVLGDVNAKVTIYEFSDFSCPYCAAADGDNPQYMDNLKKADSSWQPPVPNIIKDYVDTGKVKLVFKYYPGHGLGVPAHLVGFCLNDQGLFWKFHDEAFANQNETFNIDKMKNLASSLGANLTKLNSCIDSKKYDSQLDIDTTLGKENNVQGTPTFFVNGNKLEGAQSYSVFKSLIDKELTK